MNVVTVEDLTKSYRSGWPGRPSVHALSGLTLSIDKGEIYGFLGPNGAGKTTTIKILMGLLRSTSGKAEIFGKAAGDVQTRARIGFLPESPYFYEYLTAEEFLMFYGHLARLDRRELSSPGRSTVKPCGHDGSTNTTTAKIFKRNAPTCRVGASADS